MNTPKATCPVCRKSVSLTKWNTVRTHAPVGPKTFDANGARTVCAGYGMVIAG